MLTKRTLIRTGVATFVIGIIVMFPARAVYHWVAPPDALFSGISGSVWSGRANEVSVDGVYLRNVAWHMKPWWLLTGKLTFHINASPISGSLESDVSTSLGGKISLTSLSAAIPLAAVATTSRIDGLSGSAQLQFERIDIVDGFPIAADGTLEVSNLLVPSLSRDSLGAYVAEFSTQDGGVVASVEDADDVVDLAGILELGEGRSFRFVGQVVPQPRTPAGLLQQLRRFSPANERGQHELQLDGTL